MQKNSSDKIIRQKIKGKSAKYFYLLFFIFLPYFTAMQEISTATPLGSLATW